MRTERFIRAYTALVNAYHSGTLEKGDCRKCAVGNIIQHCGIDLQSSNRMVYYSQWLLTIYTDVRDSQVCAELDKNLGYQQMLVTGYSAKELSLIEAAFETNSKINTRNPLRTYSEQEILEDQYKGLNAVMDVLLELDNINDGVQLKADLKAHPKLIIKQIQA